MTRLRRTIVRYQCTVKDHRMATTVSRLRTDLRTSRDHLFAAIRGLTEEQFRYTPPGETWCVATHLAHLHRIERIFTERARRALQEDDPFVASTRAHNDDDPGLAQRLAVPQVIHGMLNTWRDLEAVLDRCDEPSLDAHAIRHETLGRMTLREIAVKMARHEDEHRVEIAKLVKQAPPSARVALAHVPSARVTNPPARRS
jgi:uncharacterized damage-inducible protein DinB